MARDLKLSEAWTFECARRRNKLPVPPPALSDFGEFLGDPLSPSSSSSPPPIEDFVQVSSQRLSCTTLGTQGPSATAADDEFDESAARQFLAVSVSLELVAVANNTSVDFYHAVRRPTDKDAAQPFPFLGSLRLDGARYVDHNIFIFRDFYNFVSIFCT